MHGFIFLKSEEKQLITSAARLQAVGAGRGRGNAGLGAGLRAGLTAGRSPGAGWPPRPPEAAAGGRGAAAVPAARRPRWAEPLRPGTPWARCSAGSRCAWRSSSCRAARRTSAWARWGSAAWPSSEMWVGAAGRGAAGWAAAEPRVAVVWQRAELRARAGRGPRGCSSAPAFLRSRCPTALWEKSFPSYPPEPALPLREAVTSRPAAVISACRAHSLLLGVVRSRPLPPAAPRSAVLRTLRGSAALLWTRSPAAMSFC